MQGSLLERTILGAEMEQAKARRPRSAAGNKARYLASLFRETRQPGALCDRKQVLPRLGQRADLPDYQGLSAAIGLSSARTGGVRQRDNQPAQWHLRMQ